LPPLAFQPDGPREGRAVRQSHRRLGGRRAGGPLPEASEALSRRFWL